MYKNSASPTFGSCRRVDIFFNQCTGRCIKLKELVKLRIKSIYAGILNLALFNTEIYHQYKLTLSVQFNGNGETASYL